MSNCRKQKCLCNSLRQTAVFLCDLCTSEDEFEMIHVTVVAHNGKSHESLHFYFTRRLLKYIKTSSVISDHKVV